MGFDINISLELLMCPQSGRPYHFTYNPEIGGFEKEYSLPDTQIPIYLRKYLVGRGHLFHAYTSHFNEQDIFKTDVRTFLEQYPSWDTVIESPYYTDDYEDAWNHGNHIGFQELLTFLTEQNESYVIHWSY